jgi:hypothetical protein
VKEFGFKQAAAPSANELHTDEGVDEAVDTAVSSTSKDGRKVRAQAMVDAWGLFFIVNID